MLTNGEVETMSAVKRAANSIVRYCDGEKEIDWEQRRYEIAKGLVVRGHNVVQSVTIADDLIKELKSRV